MKVKRIVANIESSQLDRASSFYRDILGLELLMDHGWIQTYGPRAIMALQISVASKGGSWDVGVYVILGAFNEH